MHVFPRDRFATNGLLTPGPLLRDLGAVVGEFNGGLDSENVRGGGEITAPQVEFEAWHAFEKTELAGPLSVANGSTGTDWVDIDGALVSPATQDGVLHVSLLLRWEDTSAALNAYLRQARIIVDGRVISQSPQVGLDYLFVAANAGRGFLHAFGVAPVGAGEHNVQAQIRVITNQNVAITTEITNLRLQTREAKR